VYNVLLLANDKERACPLVGALHRAGLACSVAPELASGEVFGVLPRPEAVIVDLASVGEAQAKQLIDQCRKLKLPVVAVVPKESLAEFDPSLNPDELLVYPAHDGELLARVKQAIYRVNGPSGSKVLKAGEISIDLERYDVTVSGRRVTLTYKEFQLLVLLVSNPGRVYSRETLLSQVWGYDYLGGTRTVDVHVRRLRSKIESPGRSFIETVYLVGYRFRITS
jgi:DNA-binding response OmpR family regulator